MKVILDSDLAELYSVETKRLNEQVKSNSERFPSDFVFQLTQEEFDNLRSQSATSSQGHGGRRTPPYAFSEHCAIMVASVLNSQRAIEMSVFVVRAFVRLRGMLSSQLEMLRKLEELEIAIRDFKSSPRSLLSSRTRRTGTSSFSKQSIGLPGYIDS